MRTPLSLLFLLSASVASAAPATLTHQGRVFDSSATPLIDAHDVQISIHDASAGGATLWNDTFTGVLFDEGYYSVVLGSSATLDPSAFESGDVYLELSVDSGPPLDRLPITSVPWALYSNHATQADVAESVSGGVVDASELRINGSTVIGADGTLTTGPTLGDLTGCGTDMVPTYSGSQWSCGPNNSPHEHSAVDITSGRLDASRLPVGSGADEVAAGNHGHSLGDLSGTLAANQLPTEAVALAGGSTVGGQAISTFTASDATTAVAASDAYLQNTGDTLAGDLTVTGDVVVQGSVSSLAPWGLTARTQGLTVMPEGPVYQNGANLTLSGNVIVMNPASGSWIRAKSGTYVLNSWSYLYLEIPPGATRGTTVAPKVGSWADSDRDYPGEDVLVLAQRAGNGTIHLNFAPPAPAFAPRSSLVHTKIDLPDWRNNSGKSSAGVWTDIPERTLTFTKRFDTSKIKVDYTDTLGTYGQYYSGCNWQVLVDSTQIGFFSDADEDDARHDWSMSHGTHTFWMEGLAAGTHTVKVQNRGSRGAWSGGTSECLQGWNTNGNSLVVEEVP